MEVQVSNQLLNGEFVKINEKGCETIDIDLNNLNLFSLKKETRLIQANKDNIYQLTLKSYKAIKKQLEKTGQIFKFNYSKR